MFQKHRRMQEMTPAPRDTPSGPDRPGVATTFLIAAIFFHVAVNEDVASQEYFVV